MLRNNTKISQIIIIFLLVISILNVKIYVSNYKRDTEESMPVTNEIEKTYGFVDALEILYSYENIKIENINPNEDRCIYTIAFNGKYDEFLSIVEYLMAFEEVTSIDNINIEYMENIIFDIEFIKNK